MSRSARPLLRGLYAITSEALVRDPARLLAGVAAALAGGATLIQYRDKLNSQQRRAVNAAALQDLCRARGVPLIVNDGPLELVAQGGFDGLHLGAADASLAEARIRLAPQTLIGVTCGNSLERALAAEADGASYAAFGAFFASRTKPNAPRASLELLHAARAALRLPICAIGGITAENAAPLIAAGADMVAAIEGVFGLPDIEAAARRYADLFR